MDTKKMELRAWLFLLCLFPMILSDYTDEVEKNVTPSLVDIGHESSWTDETENLRPYETTPTHSPLDEKHYYEFVDATENKKLLRSEAETKNMTAVDNSTATPVDVVSVNPFREVEREQTSKHIDLDDQKSSTTDTIETEHAINQKPSESMNMKFENIEMPKASSDTELKFNLGDYRSSDKHSNENVERKLESITATEESALSEDLLTLEMPTDSPLGATRVYKGEETLRRVTPSDDEPFTDAKIETVHNIKQKISDVLEKQGGNGDNSNDDVIVDDLTTTGSNYKQEASEADDIKMEKMKMPQDSFSADTQIKPIQSDNPSSKEHTNNTELKSTLDSADHFSTLETLDDFPAGTIPAYKEKETSVPITPHFEDSTTGINSTIQPSDELEKQIKNDETSSDRVILDNQTETVNDNFYEDKADVSEKHADLFTVESSRNLYRKSEVGNTSTLVSPLDEESFTDATTKTNYSNNLKPSDIFEMKEKTDESSSDGAILLDDQTATQHHDFNEDQLDGETNNTSRYPKRISEGEDKYPERRIRPYHPDPGYANYPDSVTARPYRPDVPLHKYSFFRTTVEPHSSVINEKVAYGQPSRPNHTYQRVTFRPLYGVQKTSTTSTTTTTPNIYKPSFNRPAYYPQTSFGRPYRPDYHKPASKPNDEYPRTKSPETNDGSKQEVKGSDNTREDYDTRLAESSFTRNKNQNSDIKPSEAIPDLKKPYRPVSTFVHSLRATLPPPHAPTSTSNRPTYKPFYRPTPTTINNHQPSISQTDRPSRKPATSQSSRPSSSYPRPGFGYGYLTPGTSARPTSVGTVTHSKKLSKITQTDAKCVDNGIQITMRFNETFNGLIYSSGYATDSTCSYVNGTGDRFYNFYIKLSRCGTIGKQEIGETGGPRAHVLENSVTIQYNALIEEDVDEQIKFACRHQTEYHQTVTSGPLPVENKVAKMRTESSLMFTMPPPSCFMEIKTGFGPSGRRIYGPVNVGDQLTLVVSMHNEYTTFDLFVSNCKASNGGDMSLELLDSKGCNVGSSKIMNPFRRVEDSNNPYQTSVYSTLKAFRFTGSPNLYIECDVRMCHGTCPTQKCSERLYKRSADNVTDTDSEKNVFSEKVSLSQSLQVLHQDVDSPLHFRSVDQQPSGVSDNTRVCLSFISFVFILIILASSCLIGVIACTCICIQRRKKNRQRQESGLDRLFVEYNRNVPMRY